MKSRVIILCLKHGFCKVPDTRTISWLNTCLTTASMARCKATLHWYKKGAFMFALTIQGQ